MFFPQCSEEPQNVKLVVKNSFFHLQFSPEQLSESDGQSPSKRPRCRAHSAPGRHGGWCSDKENAEKENVDKENAEKENADKENSTKASTGNSVKAEKARSTQKQSFLACLSKRLAKPAVKIDPVPIKSVEVSSKPAVKEDGSVKDQGKMLPLAARVRVSPILDDFLSTPNDFDGMDAPAYNLMLQSPESLKTVGNMAAMSMPPGQLGIPLQTVAKTAGFIGFAASPLCSNGFVATPSTATPSTATSSAMTPQTQRILFRRGSSFNSNDSVGSFSQDQRTPLTLANGMEFVPAVSPSPPQPQRTPLSCRGSSSFSSMGSFKDERRMTLMLRNLPNDYTRDMLLDLLDCHGFAGAYDFIYLPIDFNRLAGLGYAFVNCVSPALADRMKEQLQGFDQWCVSSQKVCDVCWGDPLQGLEAHIERYRNSPVMHQSVPDEYKPAMFVNGVRSAFPSPTKRIRTLKKNITSNP